MLYLTKEDMCKVFSMRDAFEALHDAFTLYSSGKSTVPLRSMIDVPHHRGQAIFMPALAGDALGIKIVSTYPDNPVRGKPVTPACMLVMGWPTRQQKEREKPARCGLRHIVHENAYRPMDGAELEEMLAHQAGERPYADWLRAFCQRKYNSGFSREMSRSAALYLEQFRPHS